jgi:AraC-like DNA-binding protein
MDSHTVGHVQVSTIEATPHSVLRSVRAARQADEAFYKVGLQMRGLAVLRQDGREAALRPGDFAIYDTTRPYSLEFDADYRMLVVMFPRALLRLPATRVGEITARSMSGRTGTGALLSPLLAGLERELATGANVNVHLSDAVLDLVAACFASPEDGRSPLQSRRGTLLSSVKSYIEEHLSDSDLTAASVAQAHHISDSYLQKVFADESVGFAAYIRHRRLERCRRDLSDPVHALKSAASIGSRWGLTDPSHFSRVFRTTYGMTPGEYRNSVSALP